jgi:hypothetical protein
MIIERFKGWMDKKLIFNRLKASYFHKHFALAIIPETPKPEGLTRL